MAERKSMRGVDLIPLHPSQTPSFTKKTEILLSQFDRGTFTYPQTSDPFLLPFFFFFFFHLRNPFIGRITYTRSKGKW